MREDVKLLYNRVARAVLTFIGSLVVSAVFILAGIGLKTLVGLSVDEGSLPHQVFVFVLDVTLLGAAAVVSICGAIVAIAESVKSTLEFLSK